MICLGDAQDKPVLKKMWEDYFAFDDGGFTAFFFNELYDDEKLVHYLLKEKDEIISAASVFQHSFAFKERSLRISMIMGVMTKEKYRHQGKMSELLKAIIEDLSHQELLTMIQAYDPELYEPFGFETIYQRKSCTFLKADNPIKAFGTFKAQVSSEELLKAYGNFAKHFDGYAIRQVKDFDLLRKKLAYEGSKVIALYQKDLIKAYAFYHIHEDLITVEEIIYADLQSFKNLLAYLFTLKDKVLIEVAPSEMIERYFKALKVDIRPYTLVRINDVNLFNLLYNVNIKDVKEAFKIMRKPLFMKEEY